MMRSARLNGYGVRKVAGRKKQKKGKREIEEKETASETGAESE